jgi:predicted Zn-dependent protease
MRWIAAAGAGLLVLLGSGWWLTRDVADGEPPLVPPGEPLAMDETVRMRWLDEESGEEDIWTVTMRKTTPEQRHSPPLPTPDPEAISQEPNESARTLNAMALESWKKGEISQAMTQLEAAVEADPHDPEIRTHYGRLLLLSMSYRDAREQLERAAQLNPDDPQVWLDLATLYQKTQALDRSWEARGRAEALAGDREIYQQEMGFWVLEGNRIYP